MPELIIDGIHVEVQKGTTLIQACELASREIPRFCYHERLAIAGNCRMCLVEVEKSPKLVASCAMEACEGMKVHTNSDRVRKAREAVMEFLLINHPLDCPICDQGGECDLQDQAMAYGRGVSRFREVKRSVEEKYMGPLIKTAMTRCIHCTRCVRFAEDIAGVPAIGTINRGENMEITTLETAVDSELSGNVIDLCPVGALTSAPYAFKARPWEMKKHKCVDVMDAVGSNISVEIFGNEVMRVLPRFNKGVNEEWISDKARFSYDGLMNQRLDRPYLRKGGRLVHISWNEALQVAANKMRSTPREKIGAIAGGMNSCEDIFMLSELMSYYMVHNVDCRPPGSILDGKNKSSYVLNTSIGDIDKADFIVLVGTNPRWEAPIINAKIRQRWLKSRCPIFLIGEKVKDLTYESTHLGEKPEDIKKLFAGEQADLIKKSERPLMLVGSCLSTREDAPALFYLLEEVLNKFSFIREGWRGYGMIQTQAGQVGGLHVGLVPKGNGIAADQMLAPGNLSLLYLLGADEFDLSGLKDTFLIYQGSHGDSAAERADLILPGAAYTEKVGTWVNTEGRTQNSMKAVNPPGGAKDDWKIFRALSEVLGCTLPYNNFGHVRAGMYERCSHLKIWNSIIPAKWAGLGGAKGKVSSEPMKTEIRDFYLTNPIARASSTMTKCSATFKNGLSEYS